MSVPALLGALTNCCAGAITGKQPERSVHVLLTEKVAVITGGASGIGRACAARFAEAGADIVIGDVQPADETLTLVEKAGRRGLFVHTDTTDDAACDALVAAAAEEFGHVDVGVAAAGLATTAGRSNIQTRAADPTVGHVVNLATEDFRRIVDVNLVGVMITCRAMARQMLAQGTGGSIVTIASTAAKIPLVGAASYCASKAGVAMLTRVMATELAQQGVRVNAVGPGYTATPMTAGLEDNAAAFDMAMSITPMGRLGTAEEVAAACLFLASDESSYFTGQMLHPAGGQFTG
jgi:NAD(P)-dependent dehydrogenase (short-subunit alcohol dehydrogenase family)